ncbi:MAG: M23 family metallopeptidase [Bacillota bacterium]
MDNAMVRYRYASKRPFLPRRRKKAPQQGNRLQRLIMFQSMACIILLLIVVAARSVNIAAANFVTSQVEYILRHDIELKSILSSTENFLAGIRSKIDPDRAAGGLTGPDGVHDPDGADTTAPKLISASASQSASASEPGMTPVSDRNDARNVNASFEYDEAGAFPEKSVLSANSENGDEWITDMIEPVEGTLATPFGEVFDAARGNVKMHAGIDIDTKPGSDVKAVLDGEITRTGLSPEYGGYVEIQHYNGLRTVYANCGEIVADEGTTVKRGDTIARTYDGGILTASHLHFEIWDGEYAIDPLEYISVPAR